VGQTQTIKIMPGSQAHKAYGQQEVKEQFYCNYGLNPRFREKCSQGQIRVTGVDLEEEVRIVELADHSFYVATLFLPQISSRAERAHPLIGAYLKAALAFQRSHRQE
jgi:CTP synthase (UTP-ammonia lyase)